MTIDLVFAFIQIRVLDIVDILLVALLLYQLYALIRGTGAMNIFLGILSLYLIWWLVRIFEMEMLSAILGQFISVGVLALIIVFQPEIRRFLLLLGSKSILNKGSRNIFKKFWEMENIKLDIPEIVGACTKMSESKTGALIVIARETPLDMYSSTGEKIDSMVSDALLQAIFYKNAPLHDGAVIISNNRIHSARCVLPVSESEHIPASLGLRHRAAAGITAQSDAWAIVVSEQTGKISLCRNGEINTGIKPVQLMEQLVKQFGSIAGKQS